MKFDPKTKKQKEAQKIPEVQIQYVPYEKYIANVLSAMLTKIEKIERSTNVIKERITFDTDEKNK